MGQKEKNVFFEYHITSNFGSGLVLSCLTKVTSQKVKKIAWDFVNAKQRKRKFTMPRPSKRKLTTPVDPRPKRGSNLMQSAPSLESTSTIRESTRPIDASEQASIASTIAENHEKGLVYGATSSGKMRDLVVIHVIKRDGIDLKTNVTHEFAFNKVFRQTTIPRNIMNSISLTWRGHPALEIRLKNKIDIDKLDTPFSFIAKERVGDSMLDIRYECEIEGVRGPGYVPPQRRGADDEDPDQPWVRWITIEGAGFSQKPEILETYLSKFGKLMTEVEEATIEVLDENPEPGEEALFRMGNGDLKVKMTIDEHIPQFLPIDGRKVKIYYKGIPKMCTACYEVGHIKANCENSPTSWMEYVANLIESSDENEMALFGRWTKIARRWRLSKTGQSE